MGENKTMDMNWLFEDLQDYEIKAELFYMSLYIPIAKKIWDLEDSGVDIRSKIPESILDKIENVVLDLSITEIFCVCDIIGLNPIKLFKGKCKLLSKKER